MDAFVTRLHSTVSQPRGNTVRLGGTNVPERPVKRQRKDEIPDSASEDSDFLSTSHDDGPAQYRAEQSDDERQPPANPTDIENALPPSQSEKDAIQKYEEFKLSQEAPAAGTESGKARKLWMKGRSSIYVDAFNLALDTVLEEETHLFDEKEKEVFSQWKALDYQSQYLYVRLFLRKTDAWHRLSRISYYDDISNLDNAIGMLQTPRELPHVTPQATHDLAPGIEVEDTVFEDSFTFADASGDHIKSIEEAASLLSLDELKIIAKDAKIQGRNKAELRRALCRISHQQAGLMSLGLSRHNSRESTGSEVSEGDQVKSQIKLRREDSNREQHFLAKVMAIVGPCVRLSATAFRLFERVHLVFYRSTEWTEKSLTTIVLAKIARRNFPEYIVCRTSTIFSSRMHLLEFEASIKMESKIDRILEFNEIPGDAGLRKVLEIFEEVYPRWKALISLEEGKEKDVYDAGEGTYLRRFTATHSYTRIVHKAIGLMGRFKEHRREHRILCELLQQRLFHMARRGSWYQRKALLEEHYMPDLDETPISQDLELRKKHWRKVAVATCEAGLQDPDCHLIYHYDLQKRILKLERKLRIPRRLQHDFGHVRLVDPSEITVEGIQLKRHLAPKPSRVAATTKTIWLDELDTGDECSVEEMCLSHFRAHGWKGYHAEGGIVRTLFAYLFYDILFLYIPNVFQTAYQTCPLDLHTDAFFPARASEINHRLVEIGNGEGEKIVRRVWEKESERKTSVVGLNWDFDIEDIVELVSCFEGSALAAVCKVMAQEYKQRGGGIPDLILWRPTQDTVENGDKQFDTDSLQANSSQGEVMFAEVKSANDRLSDTQRLWIHVLTAAGVKVALCNAVAKEVREAD